jgi:hypothetical protein
MTENHETGNYIIKTEFTAASLALSIGAAATQFIADKKHTTKLIVNDIRCHIILYPISISD